MSLFFALSHSCLFNVYITLGNRWYVAVFIRKFVLSFLVRLRRKGAQPSVREFFPVWLLQKWNLFFLVHQTISAYIYTQKEREGERDAISYLLTFFVSVFLNTFQKITHKREPCTSSLSYFNVPYGGDSGRKWTSEWEPCFGEKQNTRMNRG